MQIKKHEHTGLWVREDGAVLMPPCKNIHRFKYTWSFGSYDAYGYLCIMHNHKTYKVHRLIFESFRGPIPKNLVIDHINRIRNDNHIYNLRVITPSENSRNSFSFDRCGDLYGIHCCDNNAMYQRAYRKANPLLVERWNGNRIKSSKVYYTKNSENIKARCKARLEKLKAMGKHERTCPDGKRRFLTDKEYDDLYCIKGGV